MIKAALGFRVRSGWASAVVISVVPPSPRVLHIRRIRLSDTAIPESRQPFHAVDEAQSEFEPDEDRIEERVRAVRRIATQSVGTFLEDCRLNGWVVEHAGIVTGSLVDPSTIRAPHIRAHALEGRLFRTVLEEAMRNHELSCIVLGERTAFETASKAIHLEERALRRTLTNLARDVEGPWRAEEKLAALAAWVAVASG